MLDTGRGAVFSACGRYRYRLWREWSGAASTCTFVMLNPSTADAEKDDPTIRRCIGFAQRWGFGGIEVVNLFAWRSTDPEELKHVECPVTERAKPNRNFDAIWDAMNKSEMAVIAWGKPAGRFGVSAEMLDSLKRGWPLKLRVLGFNADGTPKHPLMVPYSAVPVMVVH